VFVWKGIELYRAEKKKLGGGGSSKRVPNCLGGGGGGGDTQLVRVEGQSLLIPESGDRRVGRKTGSGNSRFKVVHSGLLTAGIQCQAGEKKKGSLRKLRGGGKGGETVTYRVNVLKEDGVRGPGREARMKRKYTHGWKGGESSSAKGRAQGENYHRPFGPGKHNGGRKKCEFEPGGDRGRKCNDG